MVAFEDGRTVMGCVRQAVLEFDGEVQAPWRPRLVAVPDLDGPSAPPALREPSRRSPSRVGVCRPPVPTPGRPVVGRVRGERPAASGRPRAAAAPNRGDRPATRHVPSTLRLTRRARRLAVVLALCGGVVLGSWLAPLLSGGTDGGLHLAGVSSVVVEPGDTLWSIAASVADGEDVRAVVDRIQELNGLEGSGLVPGQVLQLP
jgi:nucleoid-associated protein YgaU